MKVKSNEEIKAVLQPVAEKIGVYIHDVEFKQGKNPELNIYIHKDGGVDLDTCELFHNSINEPLDLLDPTFGQAYTQNVSSRGIDWAFKTEEDFLSHVGKKVEIKLLNSIKGKKMYDGELLSYDGKAVTVKVDEKNTFTIDLKNLVKMNEYIEFE